MKKLDFKKLTSTGANNGQNGKAPVSFYAGIGIRLLLIAAVTAALLALVNGITSDRIAKNKLAAMRESIESIFVGADDIKELKGKYEYPVTAVYEVYSNGEMLGYGIQVAPVGFKDEIGMIVGADEEGACIGVEITSISDTPGVGTKVKDKGFLGGFMGLTKDNVAEFDTIMGATISSKAVKEGVAAALQLEIFGKGSQVSPEDTVTDTTSPDAPSDTSSGEDMSPEQTGELSVTETVIEQSTAEVEGTV